MTLLAWCVQPVSPQFAGGVLIGLLLACVVGVFVLIASKGER